MIARLLKDVEAWIDEADGRTFDVPADGQVEIPMDAHSAEFFSVGPLNDEFAAPPGTRNYEPGTMRQP